MLHGNRRGGHQQVHHAKAQGARGGRHDEHRLAHDLAQRPALPPGLFGGHGGNCDEDSASMPSSATPASAM
jgi:hypothetical protein